MLYGICYTVPYRSLPYRPEWILAFTLHKMKSSDSNNYTYETVVLYAFNSELFALCVRSINCNLRSFQSLVVYYWCGCGFVSFLMMVLYSFQTVCAYRVFSMWHQNIWCHGCMVLYTVESMFNLSSYILSLYL